MVCDTSYIVHGIRQTRNKGMRWAGQTKARTIDMKIRMNEKEDSAEHLPRLET